MYNMRRLILFAGDLKPIVDIINVTRKIKDCKNELPYTAHLSTLLYIIHFWVVSFQLHKKGLCYTAHLDTGQSIGFSTDYTLYKIRCNF